MYIAGKYNVIVKYLCNVKKKVRYLIYLHFLSAYFSADFSSNRRLNLLERKSCSLFSQFSSQQMKVTICVFSIYFQTTQANSSILNKDRYMYRNGKMGKNLLYFHTCGKKTKYMVLMYMKSSI